MKTCDEHALLGSCWGWTKKKTWSWCFVVAEEFWVGAAGLDDIHPRKLLARKDFSAETQYRCANMSSGDICFWWGSFWPLDPLILQDVNSWEWNQSSLRGLLILSIAEPTFTEETRCRCIRFFTAVLRCHLLSTFGRYSFCGDESDGSTIQGHNGDCFQSCPTCAAKYAENCCSRHFARKGYLLNKYNDTKPADGTKMETAWAVTVDKITKTEDVQTYGRNRIYLWANPHWYHQAIWCETEQSILGPQRPRRFYKW